MTVMKELWWADYLDTSMLAARQATPIDSLGCYEKDVERDTHIGSWHTRPGAYTHPAIQYAYLHSFQTRQNLNNASR